MPHPHKIPLLNTDTCGSAMMHAPEMEIRLEDWGWREAPVEVADRLQTLVGDRVLYARRSAVLQREPIACDELWLLERCASALSRDDLAEPVFVERWRQAQSLTLRYASQVIEAAVALPPITAYLSVRRDAPVLKGTEVFFLNDDRAAGMMVMYLRHDIFRLTCTVPLPAVAERRNFRAAPSSAGSRHRSTPPVVSRSRRRGPRK